MDAWKIDLRSDTLTRPSPAMREAMASAPVGDDVYGEDPTVNRLQEMGAGLTGKEAALFVSSGSMGNLIAQFIHADRGDIVLTHQSSHILGHELGSAGALAGVLPIGLPGDRGLLHPDTLRQHIEPESYATSPIGLIELENTIGGTCYPIERLRAIRTFADEHHIPIHMDGARLFNAVVATGVSAAEICAQADSVTFCLSKGLGAPVGSLLCGTAQFISKARRIRKMLGGGLRQSGIIAAGGIHALVHNIDRLAEDHAHARSLAEALHATSWAEIDPASVETNIIFFRTPGEDPAVIVEKLAEEGVLCMQGGPDVIRMVTHLDVSREAVERAVGVIQQLAL